MTFSLFQAAVAKQFKRMCAHPLFRTDVTKDDLWATYLNSFPAGSNPIYRVRTEHDCTCCKQFIRAVGNVVAIIDGRVETLWDGRVDDNNYQTVANAMASLVRSKPISDVFLHYEPNAGTAKNFEDTVNGVKQWDHFHVTIPSAYVAMRVDIPSKLSISRSQHDVFERGLKELTVEALDTVLELIDQNSLYRGQEHKFAVNAFRACKLSYDALDDNSKALYPWMAAHGTTGSVTGFRNTSIGTLVTALSEGKPIEDAVKAFEAMVAPANYKRPTALVTQSMINAAKAKVEELGLTTALERRYATINDITINNVLFADRSARKAMGAFDLAPTKTTLTKSFDKVEEVPIDKFLADILPKATGLELMVDNGHTGNFMSLIAPVDPTAPGMFKWNNGFSWTYNGDMADSMKERVKAAGGSVTGDLCCRLAWESRDDLDFHMREPNGYHLYFGTRTQPSRNGGRLDVDANGGSGMMQHPVENIFYANKLRMTAGIYALSVHNFCRREPDRIGFEVEIEIEGTVHHMTYAKAVPDGATVDVARINVSNPGVISLVSSLPTSSASKTVWNVPTLMFHKVTAVMLSPNFWDGQGVGNKHYFFMLDACRNDGKARGFYNEFLRSDLDAHRKVIEMVGAKMKTEQSKHQLSGLGFSSTQRNSVLCRVTGSFSRVVKIVF